MKILIVEDESKLATLLKNGLRQNGHAADVAMSGPDGLRLASDGGYDLILLDVMLPAQNGFDVLKNLRDFNIDTPVIFLSALSNTEQIVRGLDLGAMDYIKKPFQFEELLARIRIVQRKNSSETLILKAGNVEMNLRTHTVSAGGKPLTLTSKEFALLELLLTQKNRVVSKTQIAEKVWEVDFDMGSNVIEVHLSQLRKKIGDAKLIKTIVGRGYMVSDDFNS
jgi:DNA-binding response OmpR family regulator